MGRDSKTWYVGEEVYAEVRGIPVRGRLMGIEHECNEKAVTNFYIHVTSIFGPESNLANAILNTDWGVKKIEHPVETVFNVGDEVQSTVLGGGSRFIVTGYERASNRAICVSIHKNIHDRVRYAYKIDELALYEDSIQVTWGERYTGKTNVGRVELIVAHYPTHSEFAQFIVVEGSNAGMTFLVKMDDGKILKEDLSRAGIARIEKKRD